jgi:6,7-dimethyl-8-ribityllumazine synthase
MDLSIRDKLCLGNGILTVENRDQAMARADRKRKNKGRDAAMAALAMAEIKEKFS